MKLTNIISERSASLIVAALVVACGALVTAVADTSQAKVGGKSPSQTVDLTAPATGTARCPPSTSSSTPSTT